MASQNPARDAQIVAFRRAGVSLTAIAGNFGISVERVRQLLARAGEPPARTPWSPAKVEQLIALYQGGASIVRCAEALGRGRGAIEYRLHKHGIQLRPGRNVRAVPLQS